MTPILILVGGGSSCFGQILSSSKSTTNEASTCTPMLGTTSLPVTFGSSSALHKPASGTCGGGESMFGSQSASTSSGRSPMFNASQI